MLTNCIVALFVGFPSKSVFINCTLYSTGFCIYIFTILVPSPVVFVKSLLTYFKSSAYTFDSSFISVILNVCIIKFPFASVCTSTINFLPSNLFICGAIVDSSFTSYFVTVFGAKSNLFKLIVDVPLFVVVTSSLVTSIFKSSPDISFPNESSFITSKLYFIGFFNVTLICDTPFSTLASKYFWSSVDKSTYSFFSLSYIFSEIIYGLLKLLTDVTICIDLPSNTFSKFGFDDFSVIVIIAFSIILCWITGISILSSPLLEYVFPSYTASISAPFNPNPAISCFVILILYCTGFCKFILSTGIPSVAVVSTL